MERHIETVERKRKEEKRRERERTEAKDFQKYHEKYCEYWRETSSQKDA